MSGLNAGADVEQNWSYGEKKQRAGWFADNGDNGKPTLACGGHTLSDRRSRIVLRPSALTSTAYEYLLIHVGFVEPKSFGTDDIACHKSATAGTTEIAVTAGSTVSLTWNVSLQQLASANIH